MLRNEAAAWRLEQHCCYLCGSSDYMVRPGRVRDRADLKPLECAGCGLVRLSSFSHIDEHFYQDSRMHDNSPCDPRIVQKVGDEDDIRRFHDFYPLFDGKSLLDFGCGSGGFLALAKTSKCDTIIGIFSGS